MKKILILLLVLATLPFALISCGDEGEEVFDGTYTLKFIVGGVEYYSVETDGKSTVQLPENPERPGYNFVGWYFRNNDGTPGSEFTADYFLKTPFVSTVEVCVYSKFEASSSPVPGDGLPGTNGDTYYDPDGWTRS